jgi:hypothetical protein
MGRRAKNQRDYCSSAPPRAVRSRGEFGALSAGWKNRQRRKICRALRRCVVHDAAMNKNLGMLMLAIFLIVWGIFAIFGFAVPFLLGILALIAGILILIGK